MISSFHLEILENKILENIKTPSVFDGAFFRPAWVKNLGKIVSCGRSSDERTFEVSCKIEIYVERSRSEMLDVTEQGVFQVGGK